VCVCVCVCVCLQPQVRVSNRCTRTHGLEGQATVLGDRRQWDPQAGGAVLVHDGPEGGGEGDLQGEHSHGRLAGVDQSVLLCASHEGEERRGALSEIGPGYAGVRVGRANGKVSACLR